MAPLAVRSLDARGHLLARSPVTLHVADSALAAVEVARLVGRTTGRTVLIAELDGVRDSIALEVVPVPGRVVAMKGNEQHAAVQSRLPEPIVVRVESRVGRPMGGILVRFAPAEGAGIVRPDSALSGPDGLAATVWTTATALGSSACWRRSPALTRRRLFSPKWSPVAPTPTWPSSTTRRVGSLPGPTR